MNKLPLAVRLFSAAAAVAITLLLLDTVISIAAPQRVVLMALTQHLDAPVATPTTLAVAPNDAGKSVRCVPLPDQRAFNEYTDTAFGLPAKTVDSADVTVARRSAPEWLASSTRIGPSSEAARAARWRW